MQEMRVKRRRYVAMATPKSVKIVTNCNLYIVRLLQSFPDNFVDADVVNPQSGEVYTLKNSVEPP